MRILDCLVICSAVLLMSAPLCIAPPRAAFAASFDCSKAATDAEIAICASDELSEQDELIEEQLNLLAPTGRYFDEVQSQHAEWLVSENRFTNLGGFQFHLEYLRFINAYSACLFDELGFSSQSMSFSSCSAEIEATLLEECEADGGYTTLAMKVCRRGYVKALATIEAVETELSSTQNTEVWDEYRRTECDWVYETGGGSMQLPAFFSCWARLTANRIQTIFNEQR